MDASMYERFEVALKAGDVEAVKACIADGLLDDEYEPETNPLIVASRKGDCAILAALLDSPERQNSSYRDLSRCYENDDDTLRTTVLAEALRAGHEDAARLLIERGADVNASFMSFLSSWADNGSGYDNVREGICWQLASDELLEFMKGYGLDVDTCYDRDYTALTNAVMSGNAKRVEQLLALGADPNQKTPEYDDIWGWNLLAYAVYNAQTEEGFEEFAPIIKSLLKHGALINALVENTEYEFIRNPKVSVIDIVLEADNSALDELFGLQNARHLIRHRNYEIMEGYERFLNDFIAGKVDVKKPSIEKDIKDIKANFPNSEIAELATQALALYERFAHLGFIPSASKGGKALNDKKIMEHFTRHEVDLDYTAFEVELIDWPTPHGPVSEWREVKRVPKSLSEERIEIERMRLLQDQKYFRVCQECFNRNPVGWMHSDAVCQGCAQENHGVIY